MVKSNPGTLEKSYRNLNYYFLYKTLRLGNALISALDTGIIFPRSGTILTKITDIVYIYLVKLPGLTNWYSNPPNQSSLDYPKLCK